MVEPIFKNIVRKGMPEWHETFVNTNNDSTFVGYFEDGHKYDNHVDQMQFTCLIWLSKHSSFLNRSFELQSLNQKFKILFISFFIFL